MHTYNRREGSSAQNDKWIPTSLKRLHPKLGIKWDLAAGNIVFNTMSAAGNNLAL
jgi:hypothetical protein